MPNFISEDQIEKAAVKLLKEKYGYRTLNCFTNDVEDLKDKSNRDNKQEVVFLDVLKEYAIKLNSKIPLPVIEQAIEKLTSRRYAMSPVLANKEVYGLIRDGIPVEYEGKNGKIERDKVRVIDFEHPERNDFCDVTQLWIKGESYPRRPDILIYINGLPLVYIELKNSNIKVRNAYDDNLTNCKKDIPLLFQYNAFCVLSNAIATKVGSFTAGWEFFFNWLRAEDEKEKIDKKAIENEGTSLERLIHGIFRKDRLLNYIENFILYYKNTDKIVAQNHQFLGVNKAIDSFKERDKKKGKLGVFWHTQGSGKSFSMIFLARKVFDKFAGNYTFVIVTDRDQLEGQIYRNFLETGTVTKNEAAQPKDSAEMRDFLGRNKRIVFTLIQKFRWDKGNEYPLLSDRNDIIVIVDEAHRTQYQSLAENMRKGLPKAQYFAFTGTPLLGKERKTNAWFGDYVSEYNFVQSIDDEATVPLFYQKRVPEVLIQNENLSDEFYQILEDENLDEQAQEKLENEFSKELEIIKRDDRLNTIAKDIVYHFPRRGYLGKGMVVSVDKFTCVKMFDKVQSYWKEEIKSLVGEIRKTNDDLQKRKLQKILDYMRSVEMAVVVSEDGDEEKKFQKQNLDIKPHRQKMNTMDENGHDLEYRYKEPTDKLQLVFVCAMWLTGFDAPTISTLYLDKPMKDHTLMQTIARANRVTSYAINDIPKKNGELVDYYNVFRNLKKALRNYATGNEKDQPVQDKSNLFTLLDDALQQGTAFCESIEIKLNEAIDARGAFSKVGIFKSFADKLLEKDNNWQEFKVYENTISSLYEACKPEILESHYRPMIAVFQYLRGVVDGIINQTNIDGIKLRIGDLLDQSIVTANDGLFGKESQAEFQIVKKGKLLDLSKINFDKLKEEFKETEFKNIEITVLREFIAKKLGDMLKENSTRTNFAERLQEIINRYNSGGMATENYYKELVEYTEALKDEDERYIKEGLSKDELELFDILKKDKMSKAEEISVKNAAKHLMHRLMEEQPKVLIQDWFKDTQSQIRVKTAIQTVLDADLPSSYDKPLFQKKAKELFDLIFKYASQGQKWAA
ncbi:MAG: deoxyribonuclease [Planctomycetes bacterium GWF2_41_51]|nr:MAG: deoxyribonuclease [Planctomycetes bacterium GWF2_41_51]HBG28351.1 deoxyribonuclease [Phycisphaerales bacterium]